MHAVHRRTIDCRVRSKIPGKSAMVPAATVILETTFSSVSTTVSYTSCFKCPQRKKSRHVRSGDIVYEIAVEIEEDLAAAGTIADMPGHDNQWSDNVLRAYRPVVAHSSSSCECHCCN